MTHERRVLLYALAGGLPAVLISMIFLWGGDYTPKVQWTLSVLILGFWMGFAFALRERVVYPLRTLIQPAGRAARGRLLAASAGLA